MTLFQNLRRAIKVLGIRLKLRRDGSFRYFGVDVHFCQASHLVRRAAEEGIYEKTSLDLLSLFARPDTTFFDVGANIGLLSVPVLSRCPNVRVVSFEPHPRVAAMLDRTRRGSPYLERWEVRPVGLADRDGRVRFHVPPAGADAFASTVPTGRTPTGTFVEVDCTTLDREWTRLQRPAVSIIKIDVEGGELKVLTGATACIQACRPLILTEWNATNLAAGGQDPAALLSFCRQSGYRLHAVPGFTEIASAEILLPVMWTVESFLLVPGQSA